ncbi:hypothetical protein ACFQT0_30450 [Hymenobacter humi]|uniref:Uncharacterized protein n=1 Tax=Hymenobacter humi TaxID=1411620 RepID=A0ABW2UCM1_9BACT
MNQLRTLWQNFNASLWFVPTLMVAAAISRLFPNQLTQAAEPEPAQSLPEPAEVLRSQLVPARATGYVQSLDEEGLLTLARQPGGRSAQGARHRRLGGPVLGAGPGGPQRNQPGLIFDEK